MVYAVFYTYPDGGSHLEKIFKTENSAKYFIHKFAYAQFPAVYYIETWPLEE